MQILCEYVNRCAACTGALLEGAVVAGLFARKPVEYVDVLYDHAAGIEISCAVSDTPVYKFFCSIGSDDHQGPRFERQYVAWAALIATVTQMFVLNVSGIMGCWYHLHR